MLNTLSFPEIRFPAGFLWGSATAAHQIEGDDVNSREWHQQMSRPDMVKSGKACDSYRLYREDVALLRELGSQGLPSVHSVEPDRALGRGVQPGRRPNIMWIFSVF